MKSPLDIKDRVYEVLKNSTFGNEIALAFENNAPVGEVAVIFTLTVDHGEDVVDNAFVTINVLVPKVGGHINNRRHRYLSGLLFEAIENYRSYKGDFNQFLQTSGGDITAAPVDHENEFFHLSCAFSDGPATDPERTAYSYYSLRLRCWIEK